MRNQQEIQKIQSLILSQYHSLEKPQFFFVKKVIASKPYDRVMKEIMKRFHVEEDTDLNADVSYQYLLTQAQKMWSLQLSMVGSYATILRIVKPGEVLEVIDPSLQSLSELEQILMHILRDNNIYVLDEGTLEYPVPLKLFYTKPENVRLYQALFGDYDILPWK